MSRSVLDNRGSIQRAKFHYKWTKKSSNGKMLYESCKVQNPNSYFISDIDEINSNWFAKNNSVGVCGATSTPLWLMEKVSQFISRIKL